LKLFAKHIPGLGERGQIEDEDKKNNGMEAIAA
jgi:symplekin